MAYKHQCASLIKAYYKKHLAQKRLLVTIVSLEKVQALVKSRQ